MSKLRSLGIAAMFLVGCAVGGGASQVLVPPATAQQGAARQRWEYATISADEGELRDHANRLGGDGWELVSATLRPNGSGTAWFKRPKM